MTSPIFEEEKLKTGKALQKKLSSVSKAIMNAKCQYQKSKDYAQAMHTAELVKAHFNQLKRGMEYITVTDWLAENKEVTIALNPLHTPQETLEDLFVKSQKLKKAIAPLEALIIKLDKQTEYWQTALQKLCEVEDFQTLQAFNKTYNLFQEKAAKVVVKALPFHTFYSESGMEIFAGKNAQANEIVTFQVAHGNDLWLHAHGMSGSHVVIRKKKDTEIDPETLHDALQIALYFSKARQCPGGTFEVLVTEQKYVSKHSRMPKGKVMVSKHKIITTKVDKARMEKIKARTKP